MIWKQLDSRVAVEDAIGLIPEFISEADPRGFVEQINDRYIGGWRDSKVGPGGFTPVSDFRFLRYPGDPVTVGLAAAYFRNERIIAYDGAYFAVVQADGSFRVARLD